MSNVVTKVIDVRHKAPDQAIHELMQAAKDGFAVTKVVTRFNHTHVYLETSSKQVPEFQNNTSPKVGDTSEEVVKEVVKPVAKKATAKPATKKTEQVGKDAE